MKKIIFAIILLAAAVCMTGCKYNIEQADEALYQDCVEMLEDFFPNGCGDTDDVITYSANRFARDVLKKTGNRDIDDWQERVQFYNYCFCMAYNYGLHLNGIRDRELTTAVGSITFLGLDVHPNLKRQGLRKTPFICVNSIEIDDDKREINYMPVEYIFDRKTVLWLRP